jgi:carboxymethylenebutenolidase
MTGFCWHGRIVWPYAAHNPALKAGVAWYGHLASPKTDLQTTHPIYVAVSLKAPVLGLCGGADSGIPQETVSKMQAALEQAESEIAV